MNTWRLETQHDGLRIKNGFDTIAKFDTPTTNEVLSRATMMMHSKELYYACDCALQELRDIDSPYSAPTIKLLEDTMNKAKGLDS